jgi:hypothetical protein
MQSLQERSSSLSAYVIAPAHDASAEEITNYYKKACLDEILEMKTGFGSDELALRQFLWVNHKNQYLSVKKLD